MSYPLVRDLAAKGIPSAADCGVLGHSKQAYYWWLREPVSQRDLDDAYFRTMLIDACAGDPRSAYSCSWFVERADAVDRHHRRPPCAP